MVDRIYQLNGATDGSTPSVAWLTEREKRRACEKRYREKHREEINRRARLRTVTQPEKQREIQRRYHHRNKEKENKRSSAYQYKSKYALTVETRDEILKQNGGMCLICNNLPSEHIDHDHATGLIRGALCRWCNYGLGNFRDQPELLLAAVKYLRRDLKPC
jgi:hypothetical protein